MSVLFYLIPVALFLGVIWLSAFIWSIKSGQYEDLEGASLRILMDDDRPLESPSEKKAENKQKP